MDVGEFNKCGFMLLLVLGEIEGDVEGDIEGEIGGETAGEEGEEFMVVITR